MPFCCGTTTTVLERFTSRSPRRQSLAAARPSLSLHRVGRRKCHNRHGFAQNAQCTEFEVIAMRCRTARPDLSIGSTALLDLAHSCLARGNERENGEKKNKTKQNNRTLVGNANNCVAQLNTLSAGEKHTTTLGQHTTDRPNTLYALGFRATVFDFHFPF